MTKYSDPRGKSSIYSSMLDEDIILAAKAFRNEYLRPLILLGLSGAVVLYLTFAGLDFSDAVMNCLIYVMQIAFSIMGPLNNTQFSRSIILSGD